MLRTSLKSFVGTVLVLAVTASTPAKTAGSRSIQVADSVPASRPTPPGWDFGEGFHFLREVCEALPLSGTALARPFAVLDDPLARLSSADS